jgi:hypothetical protein
VKIGIRVRHVCCLSLVLFKLYSEWLTKNALEGFGDFKIWGKIIHNVKYADELALLAQEEKVLQDMIDKVTEIGGWYGVEMKVAQQNSKQFSCKTSKFLLIFSPYSARRYRKYWKESILMTLMTSGVIQRHLWRQSHKTISKVVLKGGLGASIGA